MPATIVGNSLLAELFRSVCSELWKSDSIGTEDASKMGTLRTETEHWLGKEALQTDIMNASRGNVRSNRPQLFDKIW